MNDYSLGVVRSREEVKRYYFCSIVFFFEVHLDIENIEHSCVLFFRLLDGSRDRISYGTKKIQLNEIIKFKIII